MPAGFNTDDTALAAAPAWADGSNVRFRLGRPETIGGFESIIDTPLGGVCRAAFNWTDNSNTLTVAFGTHQTLELFQGGALYTITPAGFTAGQIDGTGSSGYGTGAYGVGGYGSPSATDYFPLTWDLAALGQTLIASARERGIYQWSNNTASPAVILTNAPVRVTSMVVARDFVFALGCNEEVSGTFNPSCARHSDIRGPTGWSTINTSDSTSREYILPGGGRIVSGREIGRSILVWKNHNLFLGTYVGSVKQVWRFDQVGDKCGLIGPKAAVVLDGTAYWISPDRQFHSYTPGGVVQSIPCPIRADFADNLAAGQGDKIAASSTAEFSEVRWDYPDNRDGYENSRYIAVAVSGTDAGSWYKGRMARTAMVDAGPSAYPIGVTFGGNLYWHEKGNSADGSAFDWFIESADVYLDLNTVFLTREVWPDIAEQQGPVSLTVTTRFYPQGPETTVGPFMVAAGDDKVDFKAKARLFRIRFSGSSAPSKARLGLTVFDGKPCGRK